VTALIALDPEAAAALTDSGEVREMVKAAVAKGNAKLSRVEQVKRFLVVNSVWAPGGDELTPTMKLKRKPIAQKYAAQIERLYAATPGPDVVNV
jgi:long-chain acyl-CoA synthetase